MSIVVPVPSSVVSIIQDNTLQRMFEEALFPALLFRREARPEPWEANLGDRMIFTRAGLMPVNPRPNAPGADPTPKTYPFEQWEAVAAPYNDTIDTHLPTARAAIPGKYLLDIHTLGLNAGQTLNRVCRDPLFRAYLGGNTNTIVLGVIASFSLRVASLAGFRRTLDAGGRLVDVSGANPLAISFTSAEPNNTVVGANPDNILDPDGPGTLALGSALTTAVPLRTGVRAANRSQILRVGGAATVDGLTAGNQLTAQTIINAVAILRGQNVPPNQSTGLYHVHLSAEGEAQLYADNQFQRVFQSLPDRPEMKGLVIGDLFGCRFFRNTELPNQFNTSGTVDTSGGGGLALGAPLIGGDVVNQAGIPIRRAIVLGAAPIVEKYIDESGYVTEAGITGKIGNFAVTQNGLMVMTDRIRLVLRSPLDRLAQVVSSTWSWSGDFPIPSDAATGSDARFKRAIVIEHA